MRRLGRGGKFLPRDQIRIERRREGRENWGKAGLSHAAPPGKKARIRKKTGERGIGGGGRAGDETRGRAGEPAEGKRIEAVLDQSEAGRR